LLWKEAARVTRPEGKIPPTHGGGFEHQWLGEWGYRITRVTNSVDYRPGFALSKAQVRALIDDGWTVSVLSD
jgi:hypothetical protein